MLRRAAHLVLREKLGHVDRHEGNELGVALQQKHRSNG